MRKICIFQLLLLLLLLQHTQFSFSCNFNHQSHTHTHTRMHFVSFSLHLILRLPIPFRIYKMMKVFLFILLLLHKMQEFLEFIQSLFSPSSLSDGIEILGRCKWNTRTHAHTSHCVLNICKYLRCYDPKGDMNHMIYPQESEKLFKWLRCTAWSLSSHLCCSPNERTNASKNYFRLNSHKSFLNHSISALTFGLIWFSLFYLSCVSLSLSLALYHCVYVFMCVFYHHHHCHRQQH